VAIIMDGNGRWARKRLLNRVQGHEKGADTVRTVVRTCRELGISHLTLYAFSTENWQRPRTEVTALMALLRRFIASELPEMMENNIRLRAIGEVERLPEEVRTELMRAIRKTAANSALTLTLALSYGGRAEIVRMVRSVAREVRDGGVDPDRIDEKTVDDRLYTAGMPEPDVLIRTGGEFRVSNFLLWQIAYAEIFVTETLWPDFTKEAFLDILRAYQRRERRFGRVPT
jgi:undecaprenyl diphosphate synthase